MNARLSRAASAREVQAHIHNSKALALPLHKITNTTTCTGVCGGHRRVITCGKLLSKGLVSKLNSSIIQPPGDTLGQVIAVVLIGNKVICIHAVVAII